MDEKATRYETHVHGEGGRVMSFHVWNEQRGESYASVRETKGVDAEDAIETYVLEDLAHDPAATECYPCDLWVREGAGPARVYCVHIDWTPDVVAFEKRGEP
jgi:hypothetical protein